MYLAQALKDNTLVTQLDLNSNHIKNEGFMNLVIAFISDTW